MYRMVRILVDDSNKNSSIDGKYEENNTPILSMPWCITVSSTGDVV
jgi:hypothetical protein